MIISGTIIDQCQEQFDLDLRAEYRERTSYSEVYALKGDIGFQNDTHGDLRATLSPADDSQDLLSFRIKVEVKFWHLNKFIHHSVHLTLSMFRRNPRYHHSMYMHSADFHTQYEALLNTLGHP